MWCFKLKGIGIYIIIFSNYFMGITTNEEPKKGTKVTIKALCIAVHPTTSGLWLACDHCRLAREEQIEELTPLFFAFIGVCNGKALVNVNTNVGPQKSI